jgi:PPK2 family polyphosphate:nucleotide phosphotransferase
MEHALKESTKAPASAKKSKLKAQQMDFHKQIFELQHLFFAEQKHALLIILQGMDSSGKDGTIRHVFSCINPQGCRVKSFKTPTLEEQKHDFLWRISANLPEKGMIQIFNRSHYEDIVFPAVHKEIDRKQIAERQDAINDFEHHLQEEGTIILKFYLHILEDEQTLRLKERTTNPSKKWKYSAADGKESKKWKQYMSAYQLMLSGCNKTNPWIVVPSDDKWYRNYVISSSIIETLKNLKMHYPR